MVDYDVIIVGSGPAGMNAALYASRSKLKTLVIEKNYPGGKVVKANKIENWIGAQTIEGPELALQMFKHAFSNGAIYEQNNVLDVVNKGKHKEVILQDKKYSCYALIICTGTSERKMGIPGEDKLYGKGVSYCAICDGALYKNQNVVVVGNSDHAIEDAIYLSKYAKKVLLINDKDKFKANNYLMKQIENEPNIEVVNECKIISINGKETVASITVKYKNGEQKDIETSAVFPLIGSSPDSMFVNRLNITDNNGYIEVNNKQETKIKGIYAAGDCTNNPLKQIITATSEGAVAAIESYKLINVLKKES